MNKYQPIVTDNGYRIEDESGNVIYETEGAWTHPPQSEAAVEAVLSDASISQPTKGVLRLLFGMTELNDRRFDPSDTE